MTDDLRIGGLFEGTGGLTMGVRSVLGGRVVFHSEIEPAPNKILAHHWPEVPNIGDITKVDWPAVVRDLHLAERRGRFIEVLTGGSPCQDLSTAGRRRGMRPGTRSGLWTSMREAIAILRPRLVVWENVRGVTSACAHSELADCPRCVGDSGPHRPVLRALGRVLGDLAELGFDAEWHGLRAADIGAPHSRWREFVLAWDADDEPGEALEALWRRALAQSGRAGGSTADPDSSAGRWDESGSDAPGEAQGTLAETGQRVRRSGGARVAAHSNRARLQGHRALADEAERAEPDRAASTAADTDIEPVREQPIGERRGSRTAIAQHAIWGQYAPAIERWEQVLGRVAPSPTELSAAYIKRRKRRLAGLDRRPVGMRGSLRPVYRLSPAFVEWLMGLPDGHVTDPAIGLTHNEMLKALGNGVVPQQAAAAVLVCLSRAVAA